MRAILQVRNIAEARGYNLTRLQQETHLNMGVVSRYWHNKIRAVSFDVLEKIATVLNVGVVRLITDITSAEMEEALDDLYEAIRRNWLAQPDTKTTLAQGLSKILSHPDFNNARLQYDLIERLAREYAVLNRDKQDTTEASQPQQSPDDVARELVLLNEIRELDAKTKKPTAREIERHREENV